MFFANFTEHIHLNTILPCCKSECCSFYVICISFAFNGFLSLFHPFRYHYGKLFHQLLFDILLWQAKVIFITQLYLFIDWFFIFLTFDRLLIFVKIYLFTKHNKRSIGFSGNVWRSFSHNCCIISLFFLLEHLLTLTPPLRSSYLSFLGISYRPLSLGLKTIF